MGTIERGQKSKPKKFAGPKINAHKNPMLNFQTLKIPMRKKNKFGCTCTLFAEICGWHTWALPRVLKNIMPQERVPEMT